MMRKMLLGLGIFSISFMVCAEPPPTNLGLLKKQLNAYCTSGQYMQDIADAIQPAKLYLSERIQSNHQNKKLAVVFDADETMISSVQAMQSNDFGEPAAYVMKILQGGKSSVIKPTLELYQFAQKNHVATFIVTGRPETLRKITEQNLKNDGYKNWAYLYMSPANPVTKPHSIVPYKTAMRKKITQAGYDIVLNIGDQYSDLLGGYADQDVKLPNPFYYLP
ncbi:MAG: HAD family acid phosphatase [Pseudomonadota bacterium]